MPFHLDFKAVSWYFRATQQAPQLVVLRVPLGAVSVSYSTRVTFLAWCLTLSLYFATLLSIEAQPTTLQFQLTRNAKGHKAV